MVLVVGEFAQRLRFFGTLSELFTTLTGLWLRLITLDCGTLFFYLLSRFWFFGVRADLCCLQSEFSTRFAN